MLTCADGVLPPQHGDALGRPSLEKEPGASDTLGDAVRNMGHLTILLRSRNKSSSSRIRPIDDEFRDANNYTMGILPPAALRGRPSTSFKAG